MGRKAFRQKPERLFYAQKGGTGYGNVRSSHGTKNLIGVDEKQAKIGNEKESEKEKGEMTMTRLKGYRAKSAREFANIIAPRSYRAALTMHTERDVKWWISRHQDY